MQRTIWFHLIFLLILLAWLDISFIGFIAIIFAGINLWAATGFLLLIFGHGMLWYRTTRYRLFSKATHISWLLMLLGAAVSIGYPVGAGMYRDYLRSISVPAELNYREYPPDREGNSRLAKLDAPATLTLQPPYPQMDGSTALYSIYAAFAQAVYPLKANEYYENYVAVSKTGEAYEALLAGEADVIFVPAPSKAHQAKADEKGVKFKLTPIGKEAFVFFVNAHNPVDNLTVEQIRQIYSGSLKNWQQVGGEDQSIRAFQRPENSGSQTALQKIMGDTPLQAAPRENVAEGMGGIINRVSDYYNFNNALGYSFLFYSIKMTAKKEIKLLKINGIEPNHANIRSGWYPFTNAFYAVTVEGRESENTRKLLEWVQSPQGQELVGKTGYVPYYE